MTMNAPPDTAVDYRHVFKALGSPLALLSESLVFLAVNDAYCNVTGRDRAALVGKGLFEVFPDLTEAGGEEALRASFAAALATGQPQVMPLQRYDVNDPETGEVVEKYWSITNTPILGGTENSTYLVIHPEEVTSFIEERLQRESAGSTPRSASETRAISAVNDKIDRLEQLNALTSALLNATTLDEVAGALIRYGLPLAGATSGSVISEIGDHFSILDHRGLQPGTTAQWSSFPIDPSRDPFSHAVTSGEALFFSSPQDFITTYPHFESQLEDGHHAWAVLPLRDGNRTLGAVGLIYGEPIEFDSTVQLVLYTIASLASQAMSRAQARTEQQAALAAIDQALLQFIANDVPGVGATGFHQAASQSTSAGGDWYDVVEIDQSRVVVVIGDVASHGPAVVGEMARARSIVQTIALDGHPADEIAAKTSIAMAKFAPTHATATVAIYDRSTMTLTWTSAGHPPPFFVPSNPTLPVIQLDAPHGTPLGVNSCYESSHRQVCPGDRLILYTDGLIERRDEPVQAGLNRLTRVIESLRDAVSPDALFSALHPDHRQVDDVAILILEFSAITAESSEPPDSLRSNRL